MPIDRHVLTALIEPSPALGQQPKLEKYLPAEIDLDCLINRSVKEGLAGLLYRRLKQSGELEYLPLKQKNKMRSLYYQTASFNLKLIYNLKKILIQLNSTNIQVVLLQGIVLLQQVYQDVGLRPMTDIDLWVLPENYLPLVDILVRLGYQRDPVYPNTFKKESTVLDLHTHILGGDRIAARKWLLAKSQKHIYYDTMSVNVEGQEALCLSPSDQIIYLSLHALKHNVNRLIWLVDIKNLVSGWRSADWQALVDRARDLGQEKSILYIFFLLRQLLNFNPSKEVCRTLECQRLQTLERWLLKQRINKGSLPHWAPLILYAPNKGLPKHVAMIAETLFPKPEILRQVFTDCPEQAVWQLYLKRLLQLFRMIKAG